MVKEKTKDYIVTQKGIQGHDIGEVVKLSDEKAASLVNKIRLKCDYESDAKAAMKAKSLQKELAAMTKERDEALALVEELQAQLKVENGKAS